MRESTYGGPSPNESNDYVADELPEIEQTSIDKEAIKERIIDRVIDSAENNQPIEQQYEMSHEIKDTSHAYAPMQSVGDILSTNYMSPPNQQSVDPNIVPTKLSGFQPASTNHASNLPKLSYKKAVSYGVVAAIITAVIVGVILI